MAKNNHLSMTENAGGDGGGSNNPQQQQHLQEVSTAIDAAAENNPPKHEFNENDVKYRCCCGICPVKYGAKAIVIWEIIVIIGCGIYAIYCITKSNIAASYFFGAVMVLEIIALISLCMALRTKKEWYFFPYFGATIIRLVITFIYSTYAISVILHESHPDYVGKKEPSFDIVMDIGELFIDLVLTIWFITIVRKCLEYLHDLDEFEHNEHSESMEHH